MRKKQNTCTGIDLHNLYSFLENNADEGVIPLKISKLIASAEAMMGRELSESTVRRACKALKITYQQQAPAGTGARTVKAAKLENRITVLEEKVEYLMRDRK